MDADLLQARFFITRKEFNDARRLLEALIAEHPGILGPLVLLSHALLQQGTDPAAAEQTLRDVLTMDPGNTEARQNLEVLLRKYQES